MGRQGETGMELYEIIARTVNMGGSDIFVIPGSPVIVKCRGQYLQLDNEKMMPADTEMILREIYDMNASRTLDDLMYSGDDDFSFSIQNVGRFRCNAFRQRGSLAAVLRVVSYGVPDPEKIGIPEEVMELCNLKSGIVLVTGPAGGGKTTTLACMVDRINRTRNGHIVTIEDPIEYLHPHGSCIVSQREVRTDTGTFAGALHSALRQGADVIMLSEMPDNDTVATAITAAETGHLVLSAMNTIGTMRTVEHVVEGFPANQQQLMGVRLGTALEAVISQELVPTMDGTVIPVFDVLRVDDEMRTVLRSGVLSDKWANFSQGLMLSNLDKEILHLYHEKRITRETALTYAVRPDAVSKLL